MVGMFDSGIGGFSIWKELVRLRPDLPVLYVADQRYCPYGPKEPGFIEERAHVITRFLIDRGAQLIVVACNTATGAAIQSLRETYSVPFVGVEPATKPAALASQQKKIGILATQGTFQGQHYRNTLDRHGKEVSVFQVVGEGLVELVESGQADSLEAETLLARYLNPLVEAGIDHLVLGCTHYPFLLPTIERVLPPHIHIIQPAPAIARRVSEFLPGNKALLPDSVAYRCFTSGAPINLARQLAGLGIEKLAPEKM